MLATWRWFGPDDPVTLLDAKQAGAESIVTALHHIPNGEVWTPEEIRTRKVYFSSNHLRWEIVESLPVHDSIKKGTSERDRYIENYLASMKNLASEGIRHIVYNFMAITDWTRTDLKYTDKHSALTIKLDIVDLALFDCFLLNRENAANSYTSEVVEEAFKRNRQLDRDSKDRLIKTVLMGLPGTVDDLSPEDFKKELAFFQALGKDGLRSNLLYFLDQILPFAEELGIIMCIHADDPPFQIFDLPRIVSNSSDLKFITESRESTSNRVCFCTGTFGASANNDILELLDQYISKVSFFHLRNVKLEENGSFYESGIFDGSLDMIAIAKKIVQEQNSRGRETKIPFRPDHGQMILTDHQRNTYPGYPATGRLKSLAELRGIFSALQHDFD